MNMLGFFMNALLRRIDNFMIFIIEKEMHQIGAKEDIEEW